MKNEADALVAQPNEHVARGWLLDSFGQNAAWACTTLFSFSMKGYSFK